LGAIAAIASSSGIEAMGSILQTWRISAKPIICDPMSPLQVSRSCSLLPSFDTPIRLPSTTRRSFSRVDSSCPAVCRMARSVGPISSSAQLAAQVAH
jgi:hypothetical protein